MEEYWEGQTEMFDHLERNDAPAPGKKLARHNSILSRYAGSGLLVIPNVL